MNLYLVVSETLWDIIPILDDGSGPYEPYAIAELVVARTPSQARWLAWRTDEVSFEDDPRVMPKFSTRLKARGIGGEPRIMPETTGPENCLGYLWDDKARYSPVLGEKVREGLCVA